MVPIGGQLPLVIVDDHEPIWDWLQSGFDAFGIWHQEESWAEKPRLQCSFCEVPKKNDVIRTLYFPKNLWESGNHQGEKARSASMPQYPVSHLSNFSGVLL